VSHVIRQATDEDLGGLRKLYSLVAAIPGGLARRQAEITEEFIRAIFQETSRAGLILVMVDTSTGSLIGAIHAAHGQSDSLRHVMGRLTILIQPEFQSLGLGKHLFSHFLATIKTDYSFVMRVELRARASNVRALKLYEDLNFVQEGRFHSRIRTHDGNFEDGIPMAWMNPKWEREAPLVASLQGNMVREDFSPLEK
jgi:ribosomal protein S18 acetylase RimI-like enzyme